MGEEKQDCILRTFIVVMGGRKCNVCVVFILVKLMTWKCDLHQVDFAIFVMFLVDCSAQSLCEANTYFLTIYLLFTVNSNN